MKNKHFLAFFAFFLLFSAFFSCKKTESESNFLITKITAMCLVVVIMLAVVGCNKTETLPKCYTVTFMGEGVDIESQSVSNGNSAVAPENPERMGYDFGGWFTDNGTFVNEWNFETDIVTQDTTLYAKWEESFPIEIPFTEYLLAGTSCQWRNLNYHPNGDLIIINSNEELENYIMAEGYSPICTECPPCDSYPSIDFSKHTLLLASGWAYSSPADVIEIRLQRISANEYSLYLKVRGGLLGTTGPWNISIIVPKLLQSATITFNVQQINY